MFLGNKIFTILNVSLILFLFETKRAVLFFGILLPYLCIVYEKGRCIKEFNQFIHKGTVLSSRVIGF